MLQAGAEEELRAAASRPGLILSHLRDVVAETAAQDPFVLRAGMQRLPPSVMDRRPAYGGRGP